MSTDIWPTVHAERKALADDLADLTGEQWATPTACPEWNVHGVLAHLLSAAKMTPPKFFGKFVAAGFDFDRYVGKEVERESAGGPAATLTAFRAAADRTSAPPGPKDTWLGEVLVHSEDIRRALGISHAYPLDQVARTIAFYAGSQPVIGGRDRVAGLTLEATDTDFAVGSGPRVEGPAVALMLAATGRKGALDELAGPGVEILRRR
ncbi:MAG TPA: maleylpyruvate isomerase family mycothiol-dependent enzyme [Jatrophihabitans sp.]|jgi:uncharacterized protein (TIGR03083 family)|uniref:maleylpyruvate isomerase family mycothiol-dependent enzyme n=1 Tax=Jatrophihabitans sp. TaxID=1932789 RepID=UPI002E09AC53|nr:maleylpyruvate isomerase family mycothiol-dependent enzyme [Jatrophihabitans sp.]